MTISFQVLSYEDFENARQYTSLTGYIQYGQNKCPGIVELGKEVEDLGKSDNQTNFRKFIKCRLGASSSIEDAKNGISREYDPDCLPTVRIYF
jgi:hypothetical protein